MRTCGDVGSFIESKTLVVQTSNVGFTFEVSDYLVVHTGPDLVSHCGADDQQTADTAASLVQVTYTDVQKPLTDLREAIQQQSFFPDANPEPIVVGNPEGVCN